MQGRNLKDEIGEIGEKGGKTGKGKGGWVGWEEPYAFNPLITLVGFFSSSELLAAPPSYSWSSTCRACSLADWETRGFLRALFIFNRDHRGRRSSWSAC